MDDISNLKVGDKVLVELEVGNVDNNDDVFPVMLYGPDHDGGLWVGKENIKEVKPRLYNPGDIIKVTKDGFSEQAMVLRDTDFGDMYLVFSNHKWESQRIVKKGYTIEFIKSNKINWG